MQNNQVIWDFTKKKDIAAFIQDERKPCTINLLHPHFNVRLAKLYNISLCVALDV